MLAAGESGEDADRRLHRGGHAAVCRFGRAPAVYDLTFGFHPVGVPRGSPRRPGRGPRATVPVRVPPLHGPADDRRLVPEEALRLTPEAVAELASTVGAELLVLPEGV